MRCWSCGAENERDRTYCVSCVRPLRDPRESQKAETPMSVLGPRLGWAMAGTLIYSALLLLGLMAATIGIVWLLDVWAGRDPLVGIGKVLAFVGAITAFTSVFTAGGPGRMRANPLFSRSRLMALGYNSMAKPIMRDAMRREGADAFQKTIAGTVAGFAMFLIGLSMI